MFSSIRAGRKHGDISGTVSCWSTQLWFAQQFVAENGRLNHQAARSTGSVAAIVTVESADGRSH